ncbi:MAG: TetR/AcrR family transcriptional regulator [Anaerolineae bacterium]|jgi:AcrR family transcriptional regulator
MNQTPSKRELQRQERRQQILAAALAVFSERGFHAANVSDVAAAAGVSQGTIYWYFDSKEDLLTAAILSYFEQFEQDTLTGLGGYETAADKLRALGRSMTQLAQDMEGLFTLFMEYWASSEQREEAGQFWAAMLTEYKDVIAAIIEEGVQDGEFRPVEAEPLVWAVMAAFDGLAAYTMLVPDMDLVASCHVLVETVVQGLLIK